MALNQLSLGHVGLYVQDLERQRQFYCNTIGLRVSDEIEEQGIIFLSGDEQREHHELLLCRTSTHTSPNIQASKIQQIAFKCGSLQSLQECYRRMIEANVEIEMTVSHGTAAGVYAFDPEGNRFEVYWDTGIWAKQPFMQEIDLNLPTEDLEAIVKQFANEYAASGYVDQKYRTDPYLDIEDSPKQFDANNPPR